MFLDAINCTELVGTVLEGHFPGDVDSTHEAPAARDSTKINLNGANA